MRRRLKDKNVRRITRHGGSYAVTIPIELVEELRWKEKQKITFQKMGKGLYIADWKK